MTAALSALRPFLVAAALALATTPAQTQTQPQAQAQDTEATPFRPVAVVNDSVITAFDVTQRSRLLLLLGFQAPSVEAVQQAALGALIDDMIRLQAAQRAGFSPDASAVDGQLAELAGRLQVSPDEFRAVLSNQGITDDAMRDFLAPRAAWQSYVRGRFGGRINPSDAEIDREIALAAGIERIEVRLQEIGLPVSNRRGPQETVALANQIRTEATDEEAFAARARELSRTPSAEQGGSVGWVDPASLPPQAREALAGLEPGDISQPITTPGGVTLLRLAERRRIGGDEDIDVNDPELRAQTRERLINDQANRLAEGLLQELKRDALIEQR
ncbi:MAG: peptidylprolyl isomerase [Pseudomonadota bacterium]